MPTADQNASRWSLYGWAAVILFGVAFIKFMVAVLRGRTNVLFLVIMTAVALVLTAKAVFPRRTAKGDAFLDELKKMFLSLKVRAPQIQPGGATAEVALLSAVFGVSALPATRFPWTRQLFPRAESSGSSSSGCGSSCGSSCGGGGCGGGCGGCGG